MLRSNVNYGRTCIRDQTYGRNEPGYVSNEQKYVRYEHIMIIVCLFVCFFFNNGLIVAFLYSEKNLGVFIYLIFLGCTFRSVAP